MNQTKIRIDLNAGTIEAEGTEEFVLSIYADFKDHLGKTTPLQKTRKSPAVGAREEPGAAKPPRRGSGKGKATPKIDKALDLSRKGDVPSLREYFTGFKTKTNFERNLVFAYYLEHIREATPITLDHIFTCYRNVPDVKVPKALQ